MFIRFIQPLALTFALFAVAANVLADYPADTLPKFDAQAQRLQEKREELKQQQDKLVAEYDRFYNEITSPPKPIFLEEHAWDLLGLAILVTVIIPLFIYFRRFSRKHRKRRAHATVSNRSLISLETGLGENVTGESVQAEAGSFLEWMVIKTSRRRSRHRRHRSHRSQ
jgi:hypothetical protein